MTLRSSAGSPLDPLTLTEWRATLGTWVGVPYASMPSTHQDEINRMIEEAHDYISRRKGHEPWTIREGSFSLAASTATTQLGYDVRTVLELIETASGNTHRAKIVTKRDYLAAWGTTPTDSHPWSDQNDPKWFFDGMSSDNPPKQQWKRIPTPDATVTVSYLYRPYFELISGGSYTELPAHIVPELREFLRYRWKMFLGEYEGAAAHKGAMEDELRASSVNDDHPGAVEQGISIEIPQQFETEMNMGEWAP